MNKVSLIGNVTRDLELKTYNEDKGMYVRFTLAINNYNFKTKENETDFINIVAFGDKAEILSQYIGKGSKLAIDGKITTSSYINKNGEKSYRTEVILRDFNFIGNKNRKVV